MNWKRICMVVFHGIIISSAFSVELFVASDGNDSNPGTIEKPFATLEKARDTLRLYKENNNFIPEGATVYIRSGVYERDKPFELSALDSGIDSAPVVYRAYEDENVIFLGGKAIPPKAVNQVRDKRILDRIICRKAQEKLHYVDLKSLGIKDYGLVYPQKNNKTELFLNKKYLPLARFPDEGWLNITDVPQEDGKAVNEGRSDWVIEGIPRGRHFGRFMYPGDRPSLWTAENDIFAHGYWVYDWSDQIIRIQKIDSHTRQVFPELPHHNYGYQKDARFYFMNILSEISVPGEWYVDRTSGILYLWPSGELNPGEMIFPMLQKYMVIMENVNHVSIERIVFEGSRSGGIEIRGGYGNRVTGCEFVNLGNTAVVVQDGISHQVRSCNIYNVSAGGIEIVAGDRKSLTPACHIAENNHIHNYAIVYRTYQPAIKILGVGLKVAHNYIHDAPHLGIEFNGNNHVIEYNKIERVCKETEDVGALYSYMDWTYAGTIVRYNYLHDIHGVSRFVPTKGIYLDLPVGGVIAYGNILHDIPHGFFANSGRHNLIQNNLFIKCSPSVNINVYRAPEEFKPGGDWRLVERLAAVNYKEPPYSLAYPWMPKILSPGDDPATPYGNVIQNNISLGGRFLNIHQELDFELVKVRDNLIADPELCDWRQTFQEQSGKGAVYKYGDEKMMAILRQHNNIVTDVAPEMSDTFELKNDSSVKQIGFKPLPFKKMGLYSDAYRKVLP